MLITRPMGEPKANSVKTKEGVLNSKDQEITNKELRSLTLGLKCSILSVEDKKTLVKMLDFNASLKSHLLSASDTKSQGDLLKQIKELVKDDNLCAKLALKSKTIINSVDAKIHGHNDLKYKQDKAASKLAVIGAPVGLIAAIPAGLLIGTDFVLKAVQNDAHYVAKKSETMNSNPLYGVARVAQAVISGVRKGLVNPLKEGFSAAAKRSIGTFSTRVSADNTVEIKKESMDQSMSPAMVNLYNYCNSSAPHKKPLDKGIFEKAIQTHFDLNEVANIEVSRKGDKKFTLTLGDVSITYGSNSKGDQGVFKDSVLQE